MEVETNLRKVQVRDMKLEEELQLHTQERLLAEGYYESSKNGSITKDTFAVLIENMKTGLRGLIEKIPGGTTEPMKQRYDVTEELKKTKSILKIKEEVELDGAISKKNDLEETSTETNKLCRIIQAKEAQIQQLRTLLTKILDDNTNNMKQRYDVTEELKKTKSILKRKEEECSKIQLDLDAAISEKNDLEKTSTETNKMCRIIQAKEAEIEQLRTLLKKAQTEVENAKVQVSTLRDRKQELQKSLSREQERCKELEKLLSIVGTFSCDYIKTTAQLEDADNRLKIEYEKKSNLNEMIKALYGKGTKLNSQQKNLKDNSVEEKEKVIRGGRSRGQMEANLKKVEKRNKKPEDEVTHLKERLPAEEKTEMQTASPKPMKILETQEDKKLILHDEILQSVMLSMKGNISLMEKGFSKSKAVLNELEKLAMGQEADKMQHTLELPNCSDDTLLQNGQDSVLLKKEATFKSLKISRSELSEECERLPKEVTLAPFPSDSFKFGESQRHDRYPYWFNDAEAAVSELMDSGVITSNLETDECCSGLFAENADQASPELKVAVTVSIKGTKMLIPDTGVELNIPEGSILSRQLIEINIINFGSDKFDTLFSLDRNSSVAVQLLPNKGILRRPARLRLPHCLRLKANFQEVKSHVKIYRSEHALGQEAKWEHDPELRYELKEDCCIIFVKKLCSFRYDVTEEAIYATNVTVFTAGKQHGTSMELAVGYHLDLPGRREMLLTKKSDIKIFNAKPFEFVKDSTDTLQVHLTTAVSRAHNDEEITEVVGKLSVSEAAAKIAELPLDRPKSLHSSDTPGLEGNLHISTAILKVSETVSNKGTTMRILDTGIELTIPPYAVKGYQYIEMSVIPFGTVDAPISTFSSNSLVTVELLPNGATFSTPVRLSLPHCLKLKKGFSKRSVKVYLSHHEKDQKPFWEELPDAKYELKADHCVIYLTSFCWVKYEIDNKIVVAKRIKVYTATRGMEQNDQIAEVEVGYFIDMPGRAENLRENVDRKISQCKPLLFFKEGNLPLQICLIKVLPMFWKYSTPDRNPKVIQYKNIADSVDTSLPFVFENQDASEQKPFVMFKVSQGNEEVEINIRL